MLNINNYTYVQESMGMKWQFKRMAMHTVEWLKEAWEPEEVQIPATYKLSDLRQAAKPLYASGPLSVKWPY